LARWGIDSETEFLGVAALSVDGCVGNTYSSPDIGSFQLRQTALCVRMSLVRFVRFVPVALGKPTIDAVPVKDAPEKYIIIIFINGKNLTV